MGAEVYLGFFLILLSLGLLWVLFVHSDYFKDALLTIAGLWHMIVWPILKYPPIQIGVLLFMLGFGIFLVL